VQRVHFSFWVDEKYADIMQRIARNKGVNISDLQREAIREWCAKYTGEVSLEEIYRMLKSLTLTQNALEQKVQKLEGKIEILMRIIVDGAEIEKERGHDNDRVS
jgi:hypothetical protein